MADLVARWSGEAFHAELTGWVDAQLAALGLVRRGPLVAERVRFWAAVFHAPVRGEGHERVWVKVGNPGQAFEGPLLGSLAALAREQVLAPLAVDAARGWWLLPDGGPTVRAAGDPGVDVWGRLLEQVAGLQRRVAGRREELSVVPPLPLESVVLEVERRLVALGSLDAANPQHLAADAVASARRGLPRLAQSVDLLERLGIPDTLQPNDVSPGNACLPNVPGGPYRLFDLGDAFWSHPLAVLHLPLRLVVGARLTDPLPTSPEVRHLADRYLRCWPEVPPQLRTEVVAAADRLGAVHRALSWARLLADVDPAAVPTPPRIAAWLCQAVDA